MEIFEARISNEDLEIEIEYQLETIGKYGLEYQDGVFKLTNKLTNCLAPDKCGIPTEKPGVKFPQLQPIDAGKCKPGDKCC